MSVGYVFRPPSPEGIRPNIDKKIPRYFSEHRGERPAPERRYISERDSVLARLLAKRAGLERPSWDWQGLGSKELPIYSQKEALTSAVRDNQVTLLEGETGSGKSTQAWQYLIGEGYERVYVLVPRRVVAENLFERAREEMSEQRGDSIAQLSVGIAHGEHVELSDENKVVFLTSETFHKLNSQIQNDFKDKPIAIIGDEIHEANLPTEMAVATAAMQLAENPKWRLVLSSATHDKERVLERFKEVNGGDIPVVSVEGRPHDIEFHEKSTKNAAEVYADNYLEHEKSLFFTSGKMEIDDGIEAFRRELERRKKGSSDQVIFRKLHAKMSENDRARLNDPTPDGRRVVIVATPAGMSGMTFPGTTMVITDGIMKRPELDHEGTPGLFKRHASKSEITQMIGRGGRDVEGGIGFLVRPFEEDLAFTSYEARDQNAPAEVYNTNISRNVLTAAAYGYKFHDLNRFALHQVNQSTILDAYESLYRLQAVDEEDAITSIGRHMNELPLRPELSRGLVEAMQRGATRQNIARLAIIDSSVEAGGLAYFAHDAGEEWRMLIRPSTVDDYIAQLDMYLGIYQADDEKYYTEDELLNMDIDPKNAYRARKQYHKIMKALGIRSSEKMEVIEPNLEEEQQLYDYLLAGMIDLVYQRGGKAGQHITYRSVTLDGAEGLPTESRKTSGRSVLGDAPELVAGWPRRFMKKGEMHHVIEMAMPVDAKVLAAHAAHLTHGETIGVKLHRDKLVEVVQPMFGRLALGKAINVRTDAKLSPKAAAILEAQVLERQGEAQRQLRRIARELTAIQERLPDDKLFEYLDANQPLLTQQTIDEWIKLAVMDSRGVGEVDNRIRQKMYKDDISLDRWISPEKHEALQRDFPDAIELTDGSFARINYREGVPVITGLGLDEVYRLPYSCNLPDGREIFIQFATGATGELFTAEEFRQLATIS